MAVMATLELPDDTDGFTVEDLEDFPDDGRRYELVDGVLLVSPSPRYRHQTAIGELFAVLRAACPPDLHVVMAPVDVRRGRRTSLQPDVMVYPREAVAFDEPGQVPPLLAAEVVSPSSRDFDLGLKRFTYARLGIPSYWVVDPGAASIVVFELGEDGSYAESGRVTGDQEFTSEQPFPVVVVARQLLAGFPG